MKITTPAAAHAIDGSLHTGTLTDSQIPAAITRDAEVTGLQLLAFAAEAFLTAERVVTTPATGGLVPRRVVKSADETVNNSTTLQNDDALLQALAANETWAFIALLIHNGTNVAQIKFAFTAPTGATVTWFWVREDAAGVVNFDYINGAGSSPANGGASVDRVQAIFGIVRNGANAGNLQLQWAQNALQVSDTIVRSGSALIMLQLV